MLESSNFTRATRRLALHIAPFRLTGFAQHFVARSRTSSRAAMIIHGTRYPLVARYQRLLPRCQRCEAAQGLGHGCSGHQIDASCQSLALKLRHGIGTLHTHRPSKSHVKCLSANAPSSAPCSNASAPATVMFALPEQSRSSSLGKAPTRRALAMAPAPASLMPMLASPSFDMARPPPSHSARETDRAPILSTPRLLLKDRCFVPSFARRNSSRNWQTCFVWRPHRARSTTSELLSSPKSPRFRLLTVFLPLRVLGVHVRTTSPAAAASASTTARGSVGVPASSAATDSSALAGLLPAVLRMISSRWRERRYAKRPGLASLFPKSHLNVVSADAPSSAPRSSASAPIAVIAGFLFKCNFSNLRAPPRRNASAMAAAPSLPTPVLLRFSSTKLLSPPSRIAVTIAATPESPMSALSSSRRIFVAVSTRSSGARCLVTN
mmetsp:Transcript_13530/g.47129  ORF Transcript_13530/g.47129 Transcript_13530/m.47129 type:complete len:437 (+) Transcript_13530:895-2205(+)